MLFICRLLAAFTYTPFISLDEVCYVDAVIYYYDDDY